MPTYMSCKWPDEELRYETKPVGMRRFRIPRIFECPYFSGTMFELELVVHNDSEESKNIGYVGRLSRLPDSTEQMRKYVATAQGNLIIKARSKIKRRLQLKNLPQPGNYSFNVSLSNNEKDYSDGMGGTIYQPGQRCDTVILDALPRDYTTFKILRTFVASVISSFIGAIRGAHRG